METDTKGKSSVQVNDVLWYGDFHSSGISMIEVDSISQIKWKAGYSGIYTFSTSCFDTPKYVPGSGTPLAVNAVLPNDWTWDSDAQAAEGNLTDDKVRRAKAP